jgi:hypothetical protein
MPPRNRHRPRDVSPKKEGPLLGSWGAALLGGNPHAHPIDAVRHSIRCNALPGVFTAHYSDCQYPQGYIGTEPQAKIM